MVTLSWSLCVCADERSLFTCLSSWVLFSRTLPSLFVIGDDLENLATLNEVPFQNVSD